MRHRWHKPSAFTIAAVLLLFGAAACGGDDSGDGGSAAGSKQASSTSAADGSGTDGGNGSTTSEDTTDTTEPDVSGIGKDKDFCEGWLKAEKAFDTDQFDPAQLDDMLPVLKDLTGKAPSELRDDMKLLTDAFTQALPVLEKMTQLQDELTKDPSKAATMSSQLNDLNKQVAIFSSREFEDASARVSAYADQKCGAKAD